jgi:predicted lipoprotein
MKRKTVLTVVVAAVVLSLILAGYYWFIAARTGPVETFPIEAVAPTPSIEITSDRDIEKAFQSQDFDPAVLVDEIWDSRIIPTFDEKAVELPKILSEIVPDANGIVPKEELIPIAEKYGTITIGEQHVYTVKGSGRIVSVNTETDLGTAEVALDGYSGPIKVLLYIGTRLPPATSVCDVGNFDDKFDNFKTAMEYGMVRQEINHRIETSVLDGIDREKLTGKTVTFKGAFSIPTFNLTQIKVNEIRIVPVEMDVSD